MLVPPFSVSVLNSRLPACLSELVIYHCSPCSSLQIHWLPCYLRKELSKYPLSVEPLLFFHWPSDRDVPCLLTSWLTSGLMAQMSRHQRGFPWQSYWIAHSFSLNHFLLPYCFLFLPSPLYLNLFYFVYLCSPLGLFSTLLTDM